jgi:hypothetical protein
MWIEMKGKYCIKLMLCMYAVFSLFYESFKLTPLSVLHMLDVDITSFDISSDSSKS